MTKMPENAKNRTKMTNIYVLLFQSDEFLILLLVKKI